MARQHIFGQAYVRILDGDAVWRALPRRTGTLYALETTSNYIRRAPFLDVWATGHRPENRLTGAPVLAVLRDSVTTDHISPVGAISLGTSAAAYVRTLGVAPSGFNTYGSRRVNQEVTVRGTFANLSAQSPGPGSRGGHHPFTSRPRHPADIWRRAALWRSRRAPG